MTTTEIPPRRPSILGKTTLLVSSVEWQQLFPCNFGAKPSHKPNNSSCFYRRPTSIQNILPTPTSTPSPQLRYCSVRSHRHGITWPRHAPPTQKKSQSFPEGFFLSTLNEHYRAWIMWMKASRTTIVSATVFHKHKYISNLLVPAANAVMEAAGNLAEALKIKNALASQDVVPRRVETP